MSNKLVLPKETQEWLDNQAVTGHGRKNLYTCDTCRGETVTVDTDKGVTPFMISCRATPGCAGGMTSSFYQVDQSREATYEWYRPETVDGMDPQTVEHIMQGGLLLRPLPGTTSSVPHDG